MKKPCAFTTINSPGMQWSPCAGTVGYAVEFSADNPDVTANASIYAWMTRSVRNYSIIGIPWIKEPRP